MNRITGKIRAALATAVLAGAALTAWGININLTDGTNSVNCTAASGATIGANGDITATVASGCIPTGGGGTTGPWTLGVSVTGTGTGSTVSSDVGGISCGIGNTGTCSNNNISNGTQVTLTANPAASTTFAWGGACSGTTATCLLSMTNNKSVSVVFTSSGGGGGGDPGAGTNPWINGSTYVHNRGALTELYVPRCVPSQYNNCRAGGQQSSYDTVVAGQVWAMRIPAGTGFASQTYTFELARAETGETLNSYDIAISANPGDFNVANNCKLSGSGQVKVHDPNVYTPGFGVKSCAITTNTMYYLNVRPQAGTAGATQCGTNPISTNGCRYRILLPGGFPYQAGQ